jgi:ABC-type polysaccharide/polyol phosphate export permease
MRNGIEHFFELLWRMTEKELRARYKYTVFGFLWLVVNPILQMLIIGFIFSFFMKEPVKYYYYHLFIGLLTWNFFSLSLAKATPSIVFERSLIKKAMFPRTVIPLSIIVSNAINFLVALTLLLVPIFFLRTMSASTILYIISASGFLLLFTVGISLLTCALNVRYRDVNFFVQAFLLIWFYATPIVYSLTQIPMNLLWLWRFNPLTSILQLYQHALLGAPAPGPAMLASNIVVMIIVTALGILTFRDASKTFDDWV